jgi:ankyrin repeat protein
LLSLLLLSSQRTPLHTARDAEVALALLTGGADVSRLDAHGRSPLHLCTDANKAVVLVAFDANVLLRDATGRTARQCAAAAERCDLATLLARVEARVRRRRALVTALLLVGAVAVARA